MMRSSMLEPCCCVTHHTSSNQNCVLCSQQQEKETAGEGTAERGSQSQNSGMDGWMDGSFLINSHMHSCQDRRQSNKRFLGKLSSASGNNVQIPTPHVHAAVHEWKPFTRASVILWRRSAWSDLCAKTRCSVFTAPLTHADLLLSHRQMLCPVTGLPIGWLGLMAALGRSCIPAPDWWDGNAWHSDTVFACTAAEEQTC